MNRIILELARAAWVLMPAYVANVYASLRHGRAPLDMKKTFMGNRLLGDGKTVEGFVSGWLAGFLMASIQMFIQPFLPSAFSFLNFGSAVLIPLLAVIGDACGSFIKRRLGMDRGEFLFGVDELDFVLFPLLWLLLTGIQPLVVFVTGLFITLPIHMSINLVAWNVGIKREPW